jgi:hypothetical protein
VGREQIDQKISLFLAIKALFLATRQKEIAVGSAPKGHTIAIRRQADLFLKFSLQRLFGSFRIVDSTLWELPTPGSVRSFTYENASVSSSDDSSDIWSVLSILHGDSPTCSLIEKHRVGWPLVCVNPNISGGG